MRTESSSDHSAAELLARRGLSAPRRQDAASGKTPDLRVFHGADLAAFCERKAVARDQWLERQLVQAKPSTMVDLLVTQGPRGHVPVAQAELGVDEVAWRHRATVGLAQNPASELVIFVPRSKRDTSQGTPRSDAPV